MSSAEQRALAEAARQERRRRTAAAEVRAKPAAVVMSSGQRAAVEAAIQAACGEPVDDNPGPDQFPGAMHFLSCVRAALYGAESLSCSLNLLSFSNLHRLERQFWLRLKLDSTPLPYQLCCLASSLKYASAHLLPSQ